MREEREPIDDNWLDRLDEIATGIEEAAPGDDELLHVAGRLSAAFAPLRELDAPARAHRHQLGMQLRRQLAASTSSRARKKWLARPLIAVAAILLFMLLGPGLIFELNAVGNIGTHASGSARSESIARLPSDYSFAILPVKDFPRGLTLLLPTNLAPDAYLVASQLNEQNNSVPANFYLVYTQSAHLYESPAQPPSNSLYTSTSYSPIQLGSLSGILLQTSNGENRIVWYEQGLLCNLVSSEPVPVMVAMIEQLQTVTY